ncbi:hypothetical protein [Rhizobium sullae]|uniref:hypothetical protein n=1 Tax=Rhizobium sullae TaxID=50338 RepID=UPI001FE00A6F|nr:hypothetical protein [Rhizobium sullae]
MLRISCSEWFGLHVLSPILAEFSLAHPKIVVELLTDARLLTFSAARLISSPLSVRSPNQTSYRES